MKTSELAKTLARELRKNQTGVEKLFWEQLRNRNFIGLKFTRQHPIYYSKDNKKKFFITDFFCNELKLAIELDGKIHKSQKEYDQAREEILQATGHPDFIGMVYNFAYCKRFRNLAKQENVLY